MNRVSRLYFNREEKRVEQALFPFGSSSGSGNVVVVACSRLGALTQRLGNRQRSASLHQMCLSGANHSGLLRRHIMTVLQYSFGTRRLSTLRRDFYLFLP